MNQVAIRGLRYAQALIGRTYEFLCPAVSTPTLLRADFRRNWFFLLQKAFRPVDQLLSEGKITEEVYYRALASHLGCQYYSGDPPFARAFDAVKGLRCGAAPIEWHGAGPRMVIAPRAQFVPRLIEATLSGAIRSGSFALTSPQRFASLVRAYRGTELLDVALGRLPTSLTAREGMTGLQIAAVGAIAILALVLAVVDFDP